MDNTHIYFLYRSISIGISKYKKLINLEVKTGKTLKHTPLFNKKDMAKKGVKNSGQAIKAWTINSSINYGLFFYEQIPSNI